MKKFMMLAFSAVMALAAFSTWAADSVVNATGTVVYGAKAVLSIDKDTSSGNRVAVKYSSGVQYVIDDASWTKYGKFAAILGTNGVQAPGTNLIVNVSASNGVYCQNSQSLIAWPLGQMDTLSDGCAFWQAAKAVSQ
jgi:hypothetical protein